MATKVIPIEVIVQQNVVKSVEVVLVQGEEGDTAIPLTWITLSQLEFNALPQSEKDDSSIMYDIQPKLLLDVFPSRVAYSLRKLRNAVINVVRVRRDSDNAEQDFTADGIIDGSLLTFVGAGSGFATTLFDQSGNGDDVSQTTASSQPTIVSSGSLVLDNGKPALEAFGAQRLQAFGVSLDITLSTSFAVFNLDTANSSENVVNFFGADLYLIGRSGSADFLQYFSPFFKGSISVNSQILSSYFTTSTGNEAFVNGSSDGSASGAFDGSGVIVLRILGPGNNLDGKFQELVFYLNDQTANRATIESEINSHYTIF